MQLVVAGPELSPTLNHVETNKSKLQLATTFQRHVAMWLDTNLAEGTSGKNPCHSMLRGQ